MEISEPEVQAAARQRQISNWAMSAVVSRELHILDIACLLQNDIEDGMNMMDSWSVHAEPNRVNSDMRHSSSHSFPMRKDPNNGECHSV